MQTEGYCECGCGRLAPIAPQTINRIGQVKGQPKRFIHGHNTARRDVAEHFWAKVDRGAPDECWPWTGPKDKHSYGRFNGTLAHRVAYTLAIGPIPPGLTLDHVRARGCARRDCCNPAHLEPVTLAENKRRGNSPAAMNARKTHCIHGHELAGDNVYLTKQGWRYCRTCMRSSEQRRARNASPLTHLDDQ